MPINRQKIFDAIATLEDELNNDAAKQTNDDPTAAAAMIHARACFGAGLIYVSMSFQSLDRSKDTSKT